MKRVRSNSSSPSYMNTASIKPVKTVSQLKKKYDEVPLGFLYGITEELEYQCPRIDKYIEKIEECKLALSKARRARTLETKDGHIMKALYSISELDSELDTKTRSNFISLREFALQWKRLAIRLLNETKAPEKFILKNWNK